MEETSEGIGWQADKLSSNCGIMTILKGKKSYNYVEKGLLKLGFEPRPPKPSISNSTYVVKVCSFWSELKLAEL